MPNDNVGVVWVGMPEFGAALDVIKAAADIAGREILVKADQAVGRSAATHMQGRPGPNRRSGDLMASVLAGHTEPVHVGYGKWVSQEGPTVPYGRRIELGFHGADRLGRVYHQAALPYLQPGLMDSAAALEAIAVAGWAAALQSR